MNSTLSYEELSTDVLSKSITRMTDYYIYKILVIDLINDHYTVIKAPNDELEQKKIGHVSSRISDWFNWFATSPYCHPEDRGRFLELADIKYLHRRFVKDCRPVSVCYRRKSYLGSDDFAFVRMEIIPQRIGSSEGIAELIVRSISEVEEQDFIKSESLAEELVRTNRRLEDSQRALEEALSLAEAKNRDLEHFYSLFYSRLQELNSNNAVENTFKYLKPEEFDADHRQLINSINNTIEVSNSRIKSEHLNLKLINHIIHSGMWSISFDYKGKINKVRWSSEFRYILGFNDETDFPDNLNSWADRLHPSDKMSVLAAFFGAINDTSNQKKYDVEFRMQNKKGDYHWYRAAGELNRNSEGIPVVFIGIFIDINDLKERDNLEKQYNTLQLQLDSLIGAHERDAMTGCKNKDAYNSVEKSIQTGINEKTIDSFSILSVDINGLKTINDSFGHETGNIYIKNCTEALTYVYGLDNVYRTGGDEFVVVVTGREYGEYSALFRKLSNIIEESSNKQKPEERISMALGMAVYEPFTDYTVRHVFERADELMYENKKLIKNNMTCFPRMWGYKYEQAMLSNATSYFEVNITQNSFMNTPVFFKNGQRIPAETYKDSLYLENFEDYIKFQSKWVSPREMDRYLHLMDYNNLFISFKNGKRELIEGFDGIDSKGRPFRFRIIILLGLNDYTQDLIGFFIVKKTVSEESI